MMNFTLYAQNISHAFSNCFNYRSSETLTNETTQKTNEVSLRALEAAQTPSSGGGAQDACTCSTILVGAVIYGIVIGAISTVSVWGTGAGLIAEAGDNHDMEKAGRILAICGR